MDVIDAERRLNRLRIEYEKALADYAALVVTCPPEELDVASRTLGLGRLECEINALIDAIERYRG